MKLWKRKQTPQGSALPLQVQTAARRGLQSPTERHYTELQGTAEWELYRCLRRSLPVVQAGIGKLVRLLGEFEVTTGNAVADAQLKCFLQEVPVNRCQQGISEFIAGFFDQLLTYGTAVGEMVLTPCGQEIAALYQADLRDLVFREGSNPLEWELCRKADGCAPQPVPYPALVLKAALHPPHGKAMGVSILQSIPFVSQILLGIYRTIGTNWDRVGNIRYAVTYKPGTDSIDRANAREHAEQMAQAWSRAMEPSSSVSDFVAVGDVSVQVIGADNQILDSQIPVRQMLEQIVAALGIPPFLLGFSWASTERMSSQQADILTSEMEAYRRTLEPVICRICNLWLALHGYPTGCQVDWKDITLQDAVELAEARLKNAQALQIEAALEKEETH